MAKSDTTLPEALPQTGEERDVFDKRSRRIVGMKAGEAKDVKNRYVRRLRQATRAALRRVLRTDGS